MNDTLLDDFERPLRALCTDDTLRAIEGGATSDALWHAIDALGYTDALMTEEQGGAGLSLRDLFAPVFAAGKAGLGLPFGETAVARALLAATAKLRACEAARSVCAIAHAVFGAIGITEEHVLGLYTRRLHEWRAAPGTETQCARLLGQALLAQPDGLFDFVRLRLSAPALA
jgi:alkylation response protein AidB-like acyl-CoA dehydrogenase